MKLKIGNRIQTSCITRHPDMSHTNVEPKCPLTHMHENLRYPFRPAEMEEDLELSSGMSWLACGRKPKCTAATIESHLGVTP